MSCGRNKKGVRFDSDKRHYTRVLKRNIACLITFTFFGVGPNFTLNYPGTLKTPCPKEAAHNCVHFSLAHHHKPLGPVFVNVNPDG